MTERENGVAAEPAPSAPEELLAEALRAHAAQTPLTEAPPAEPETPEDSGTAESAGTVQPAPAEDVRTDQEELLAKALRAHAVRASVPTTPARQVPDTAPQHTTPPHTTGATGPGNAPDTTGGPDSEHNGEHDGADDEDTAAVTEPDTVAHETPADPAPDAAASTQRTSYVPVLGTTPQRPIATRFVEPEPPEPEPAATRQQPSRPATALWIVLLALALGLAAGALAGLLTVL